MGWMSFGKISRLLIANRGEIACRIAKSAKLFGCHVVGVYSDIDRDSLHVSMMDEAYHIGPAPVQESYLSISNLISTAGLAKVDAVHPGYGFLSESVEFCQACLDANLIFVGPPLSAMRDMGIKNKSKVIMSSAGVPVIEGYHGEDQSDERLRFEANKLGYPVMIKAVRGGGGKGMRIAYTAEHFDEQLSAARRESLKAFNDADMLIEKYIDCPRHVEVQVFGDHHGNYVHLWERDCSIQRRHQKILEEAPAPGITPSMRKAIGDAAVAAARAVNYVGAGTVEFVMDSDQNFYFMEMNTRLQVEHPITEAITGTDLVNWQLTVASGEPLPIIDQSQISLIGHAFEARIYAEDCTNPQQMMPVAGRLGFIRPPSNAVSYSNSSTGVRVDSGVRLGDEISVYYDPLIAKLVVFGKTRKDALDCLNRSLADYHIAGLPTNIAFLRKLVKHPNVITGKVHTGFITEHLDSLRPHVPEGTIALLHKEELHCAATIWIFLEPNFTNDRLNTLYSILRGFRVNLPSTRHLTLIDSSGSHFTLRVTYPKDPTGFYLVELLSNPDLNPDVLTPYRVRPIQSAGSLSCAGWQHHEFVIELCSSDKNSRLLHITAVFDLESQQLYTFNKSSGVHASFSMSQPSYMKEDLSPDGGDQTVDLTLNIAPIPGVIERVFVSAGDKVVTGQALVTLIAMKMEFTIRARSSGYVEAIEVSPSDTVAKGQPLVRIKTSQSC